MSGGYYDPESGRVYFPDEEDVLWTRELYREVDAAAVWAKGQRLAMLREAAEDLNRGADPFNVARMMTEYSQLLDYLDGLPQRIRQVVGIIDDDEEGDCVPGMESVS